MIAIGIVGHGADKFTPSSELAAKHLIRFVLLEHPDSVLVSGHSPMGGIDIWSEEIASELNVPAVINSPTNHSWDGKYGYKARNIDIAKDSDIVHVVLVDEYPPDYRGRKFNECYHCAKHPGETMRHVKSGGCWTAWYARSLGKPIEFHVIKQG